jgi:signal transduction histidine kinase
MEERAKELGGRLEIRSARGSGTTVALEVPVA